MLSSNKFACNFNGLLKDVWILANKIKILIKKLIFWSVRLAHQRDKGVWSQFSLNKLGSSSAIISNHFLRFTFSDCDGGELILYVCFLSWRVPAVRVECVNMCLVCLSNCFNLLVMHL